MESQVGVVYRFAVSKSDVIADLETETIAVIVPGSNIPEAPPVTMLDENSAGEVAVNVLILLSAAVEHDVFYNDIIHVFSG
jgi:hypothetical protein